MNIKKRANVHVNGYVPHGKIHKVAILKAQCYAMYSFGRVIWVGKLE